VVYEPVGSEPGDPLRTFAVRVAGDQPHRGDKLGRARAGLALVIVTMPQSRQGTYRSESPELPGWVAKRAPLPFALLPDEPFDQPLAPSLLTLDSVAQLAVHPVLLIGRVTR
jgi:hypothetical protein